MPLSFAARSWESIKWWWLVSVSVSQSVRPIIDCGWPHSVSQPLTQANCNWTIEERNTAFRNYHGVAVWITELFLTCQYSAHSLSLHSIYCLYMVIGYCLSLSRLPASVGSVCGKGKWSIERKYRSEFPLSFFISPYCPTLRFHILCIYRK